MELEKFSVGARFETDLLMSADVMSRFREISGDTNPMHTDAEFATQAGFQGPIVYGNLLGALVSNLVGMVLPTKSVLIVRQSMDFRSPVYVGEAVALQAVVSSIHESVATVSLDLRFSVSDRRVATGVCVVKCL